MTIQGIRKEQVTIDVTAKECFLALLKEYGLYYVFQPTNDTYWKEIKTKHFVTELREMENVSYHGSPQYEETGRAITDKETLTAYYHMKALNQTFHYI